MKTPLLFLCHRIPYPPNKGDKIRSFHLLHHLSKKFDIYLGTFIDDPADWAYEDDVRKFCSDVLFVQLQPRLAKLRSLTALITGQALSVPYYSSQELQEWVDVTVENNSIKHVIAFSSPMAQFVMGQKYDFVRKIVDFVDVDSDKWQQYSEQKPWPLSWLYRREACCLLSYEKTLAADFDAGLFVSSPEASLFRQLDPSSAGKIGHYNNGVNSDYFSPRQDFANPYRENQTAIVFTGAMDYWPNIDAVIWFVNEVLPTLQAALPALVFYIVGSNPTKAVLRLANLSGVFVTGRVDDVRPYLQHSVAVVAPMRVARGVQNKVLEAMAMERPAIVSTKGLEGIEARNGEHVLIADTVEQYLTMVERVLAADSNYIGKAAREYVKLNFDWDANLPEVALLISCADSDSRSSAYACSV